MKFKLFPVFAFLLFAINLHAQQQTHPKREFRGAWIQVVNGQFMNMSTQKMQQTLIQQLDALEDAGINAVIFQVRPEADALYESSYEPWSRFLTGIQGKAPIPYWDPMKFMIDECHKRNMEFHAWINPYRAKTNIKTQLAANHIYHTNPEWFIEFDNKLFFDQALPETRKHVCKIISDIVSRYDVDAIHMDDYFYPYPVAGKEYPDDVSFSRTGSGFDSKGDWRRNNVNVLIKQVHSTIREIKPWVKFGVSPFGVYRNKTASNPNGSDTKALQNYDDLYADVLYWAREGWIDYTIPQIYWHVGHPVADYGILVDWWARNTEGCHLFIGQDVLNTLKNADPENPSINQLPRKMRLQRSYATIEGSCQWPASEVINNTGKYRDALKAEYYKYPALMPIFHSLDNTPPKKVRKVKEIWTEDGYILFWTAPKAKEEMDQAVQYVVYRFNRKETVNLEDPSRIVAITRNNFYKMPYDDGKKKYRYVITALDRLQNESKGKAKNVKL
ncbi:MAG: family 10 glycosylhydrolase [Bacteroides sp.]|nr:family 10 glycosylhydrolase [Bacteroides sp.]